VEIEGSHAFTIGELDLSAVDISRGTGELMRVVDTLNGVEAPELASAQ